MSFISQSIASCFPGGSSRRMSGELPLRTCDHELERARSRDQRAERSKFSVKRLIASYWSDWLLIIALWCTAYALNRLPGHKREFSLNDLSIQYTFAVKERVPSNLLAFISLVLPVSLILVVSIAVAHNPWDIHNGLTGVLMAWTMTGVVTQVIKMLVGRPRPDLIDRCQPRAGAHDRPVYGLSTVEICTQTEKWKLNDGFKSFPSGHSSLAFAGMGYLSFYLAGKMHLWDVYGNRNRAWFCLSPLLLGAIVAISRTEDNRHHWQDVLVGSTLGLLISFVAYRTYYPHLGHASCHLPLLPRPNRFDDEEMDLPQGERLLDDESGIPRISEDETAWRS